MGDREKYLNYASISLLSGFFAPIWGVGYVIPFYLAFLFFIYRGKGFQSLNKVFSSEAILPVTGFLALFVVSVLFSSIVHTDAKWSGEDGFWVSLAIGVFFLSGFIVGNLADHCYLLKIIKRIFLAGFSLIIATTVFTGFEGAVWANTNAVTATVLMVTGGTTCLFFSLAQTASPVKNGLVFSLVVSLGLFFLAFITTSDAALPLMSIFFILIFFLAHKNRYALFIWGIMAAGMIIALLLFVELDTTSFEMLKDSSDIQRFLSFRPQIILQSLAVINNNPIFGIGAGSFMKGFEFVAFPFPENMDWFGHTHSIFLLYLVSSGIVAGMAYVSALFFSIRMILAGLREERYAHFAMLSLGILFFYLGYGLVEATPASRELVPLVWGSIGLLAGVYATAES